MIIIILMVLIVGLREGLSMEVRTTALENNENASNVKNTKDNKTVIELNKDITVNTDLNLDKALAQLNGTEASYIPKIRKVTHLDNDIIEVKQTNATAINATNVNVNITAATTIQSPTQSTQMLTEGGGVVVGLKVPAKNDSEVNEGVVAQKNITEKTASDFKSSIINDVNKIDEKVPLSSKNIVDIPNQQSDKDNKTIKTTATTASPITTAIVIKHNTTKALNTATTAMPTVSKEHNATNTKTTPTTKSTTTTTRTTSTTTTTITTFKPKKPTITYSVPDFPDLEKDNPELNSLLQSSVSSSDGPYAQPSQEYTSNSFQHGRDFILPIVSMIFLIPLVIGIMITSYRRFRDCWSTRHYRRMDFLVDGMYND